MQQPMIKWMSSICASIPTCILDVLDIGCLLNKINLIWLNFISFAPFSRVTTYTSFSIQCICNSPFWFGSFSFTIFLIFHRVSTCGKYNPVCVTQTAETASSFNFHEKKTVLQLAWYIYCFYPTLSNIISFRIGAWPKDESTCNKCL